MRRYFNLPALCGLLAAAGIALSVRHAAAAPTWDGAWGTGAHENAISTCTHPGAGSATGAATLNGNDATQVVSWCANYNCGSNGSIRYFVRGLGCSVDAKCEYTGINNNGSTGQSVGSTAGLPRLTWHACQMGTELHP